MGAGGFALLDCGGCVADLGVRGWVSCVNYDGSSLSIKLELCYVAEGLETVAAAAALNMQSLRSGEEAYHLSRVGGSVVDGLS